VEVGTLRLPWRKEKTDKPKPEQRFSLSDAYGMGYFNFSGHQYGLQGYTTTYGNQKAEPIGSDFEGLVRGALEGDGIVAACERLRTSVFSEIRFQWQSQSGPNRGDLFGTTDLQILERPYPGGTTGDLLSKMLLDADFAGNAYVAKVDGELVRLRPDWVEIVLAARELPQDGEMVQVGYRRAGYFYYEGGITTGKTPFVFLPNEVAHFAPRQDPLATYRGTSWLTPIIREIQADKLATDHKVKFFENAATPNLAVSLPKEITPDQFNEFVEAMDSKHKGVENAYKTLYTAGGADVTVIGANMQQLDFKSTQGAGETRIAAAARVHPVLVGLSEGLGGSSLNAGNYTAAKRAFADGEMRSLWRNVAGSLEVLLTVPDGGLLWFDTREVAFLREDEKDLAEIRQLDSITLRNYVDAGWEPDAAVKAVKGSDVNTLTGNHTGLFSVQLQAPGATQPTPEPEQP
jgi:phage portal protein BeeE